MNLQYSPNKIWIENEEGKTVGEVDFFQDEQGDYDIVHTEVDDSMRGQGAAGRLVQAAADYIRSTGHHVLYRVTPVFEGNNLVASGVLMEAQSVEDDGLVFCVYCYNVQPGVTINYSTGDSSGPEFTGSNGGSGASSGGESGTYVLNTNTKKFHRPDCPSADKIKPANRQDFTGSREDLIAQGYDPCKSCNP